MTPFYSSLHIDKSSKQPVYLQLTNQLMGLIRTGVMHAGQRLPSSRQMAEWLGVHRKTVVKSYEELLVQGWLESHTGSGTFVARHLPKLQPQALPATRTTKTVTATGIKVPPAPHLNRMVIKAGVGLHLDDGFPDPRLAPLEELARAYRSQLLTGNSYIRLGYSDTMGSQWLRQQLSEYLQETRGLHASPENILIVRGTTMAMHLAGNALLQPGDNVAISEFTWGSAMANIVEAGANPLKVPVDEHGIDTVALERLCRRKQLRMLYVTPHHHYPTTVVLRADRRMHLLQLSEKYGFFIFEDDYDYDFHYHSKPLLPLASADRSGMVLYSGSFTKSISPGFRVGYITGPEYVITHLAKFRRIIDRQGDTVLENAIAELLQEGVVQRCLRKSLRLYKERRDVFCALMQKKLKDAVSFEVPVGGLAVWATFAAGIDLKAIAQQAFNRGLYLHDGSLYAPQENTTRLGFASSTPEELKKCVDILAKLV
ncbi:MAG TPA: PLP-dependent aminotransferase family protein [Chitinophaga sp.]|uniref:aminotransferase-like domain-containing protein n=1 Tax=Chitinophaga sp. TaxID=1869181 RepID=UPI002B5E46D8|nr:PLP-dependent aminotransferase family protein [Chitinophaga sp.]HVI47724.1 PLP-dependent aminotransferase family protein [Chitinophaga sp.]